MDFFRSILINFANALPRISLLLAGNDFLFILPECYRGFVNIFGINLLYFCKGKIYVEVWLKIDRG